MFTYIEFDGSCPACRETGAALCYPTPDKQCRDSEKCVYCLVGLHPQMSDPSNPDGMCCWCKARMHVKCVKEHNDHLAKEKDVNRAVPPVEPRVDAYEPTYEQEREDERRDDEDGASLYEEIHDFLTEFWDEEIHTTPLRNHEISESRE